jgi:F-type H+-transporting ATPase subunit b
VIFAAILAQAATTTPTSEAVSKNPILPSTPELVWGILSFAILFAVMAKLGFPAVQKAMTARAERIRSSLDEAEHAKAEAESILDDYQRKLADARNESNRIIEEARQAADAVRKELMARAETDAQELRQRTQQDLEAAQKQALENLKQQVAKIAVGAAEKIIERNLDEATQLALVENFINQVESAT